MPGPGITRPDLCSKRAAARQAEFADTARGPLSADSYPLAGDNPLAPVPHYAARTLIEASAPRASGSRIGPQARLVISGPGQRTEAGR